MTYTPEQIEKMENSLATANKNGLPDLAKKIQVKLNQIYAEQEAQPVKKSSINLQRFNFTTPKTPKKRKTVEQVEAVCDVQIDKIVEQKQEIKELKAVIAENGFVKNKPKATNTSKTRNAPSKTIRIGQNNKVRLTEEQKFAQSQNQQTRRSQKTEKKSVARETAKQNAQKRQKQTESQAYKQKYAQPNTRKESGRSVVKTQNKRQEVPTLRPYGQFEESKSALDTAKKLSNSRKMPKREAGMAQTPVISISEQVKIIKRFVGFFSSKKENTAAQLENLFTAIKKALLTKKIQEGATYADQVMFIQKRIQKALLKPKNIDISLDIEELDLLLDIAQSEKVSLSVAYLSQYINLMKNQDRAKIANLAKRIEVALEKGAITESSYYFEEIKTALAKLKTGKIVLNPEGLAGLDNIINGTDDGLGCLCNGRSLNGLDSDELSGAQLHNASTQGIGFTDEWLELMGDPTLGFSAVVFGPPKAGKTIFNMLFADYLQRNFGNVLYVSIEEFGSPTLAMKVQELELDQSITFRGDVNTNLNGFSFVFLDSATKGNISFEEVEAAKKMYPNVSFITVLQVTKNGNFRGGQQWTHNTDVIINVREGWADAYGRFGAGELDIFHLADNR